MIKQIMIFFLLLTLNTNLCSQKDNGVKGILAITGVGIGYENEVLKRTCFEVGVTSFLIINRVYIQSKYAIYSKDNLSIKLGADISYINCSLCFFKNNTPKISPLICIDGNRFGVQFSAREPEMVDYPIFKNGKKVESIYIILGLTYKFSKKN